MAHPSQTYFSQHAAPSLLLWALLFSIILHGAILGFAPGLSFQSQQASQPPLTVDLITPPPPPPLPKPEPIKPKPIQPPPVKPPPVKLTVPSPQPVLPPTPNPPVTKQDTPPPVAEPIKKEIPSPPVIAVDTSPSEPVFVAPNPPPEPVPVKVASEDDIANARSSYGKLLGSEFARHKKYPTVARVRGWQGTVLIQLQIDAEGHVSDPVISQGSGKTMLDDQALETVKKALPLPPPPTLLRGKPFTIAVPIVFRLETP